MRFLRYHDFTNFPVAVNMDHVTYIYIVLPTLAPHMHAVTPCTCGEVWHTIHTSQRVDSVGGHGNANCPPCT